MNNCGKPIDVFISYAQKNNAMAKGLYQYLQARGIECWKAQERLKPGTMYPQAITEAINQSAIMLVLLTRDANNSLSVAREVEQAYNNNLTIVPVKFFNGRFSDNMAYLVNILQWIDAAAGYPEKHFGTIYRSCAELLNKQQVSHQPPLWEPIQRRFYRLWRYRIPLLLTALVTTATLAIWRPAKTPKKQLRINTRAELGSKSLPVGKGILQVFTSQGIWEDSIRPNEGTSFLLGAANQSDSIRIRFSAPGFCDTDTMVRYPMGLFVLPVKRNSTYGNVAVKVSDFDTGKPLTGIEGEIKGIRLRPDSNGQMLFQIPPEQQQKSYTLYLFNNGVPFDTRRVTMPRKSIYGCTVKMPSTPRKPGKNSTTKK
ncbi:MAG: toll/interleukin-1 receptor domain-containing protein [Dinghuibacter sp.]|nr:toll/interleukin-1 receptor domain-containing protein [Dinghuibacter sp.]